jgi:quercetin dioxygenase-like cupin family protein
VLVAGASLLICGYAISQRAPTTEPTLPSSAFDWTKLPVEQTQVGQRRQVFRSRTGTLDEMEVHITTLNPGQAPHAPHRHPDEEMIMIKEGTLEVTVNGKSTRIGPGSVFFVAPNDLHGFKNVGDTQATYFVQRWLSPGMKKAQ